MACRELSALRLGLMDIVGIEDPAEKNHDLKELGDAASNPGPLKSMMESSNFEMLSRFYGNSLVDLQEKVSHMSKSDKNYAYYQALLVLTKKVEQELQITVEGLKKMYLDLDEIHHFLHEIYPGDES